MATSAGTTRPLPEETGKPLEHSLKHLVDHSEANQRDKNSDPEVDAVHSKGAKSRSWISRFFPSEEMLDELFAYEHMGNYVIDRQTGEKIFESMPIYVRVGMHLLFVKGASYMSYSSVEHLLMAQSIRQGKVYDQTGAGVRPHIQAFIDTYQLPLDELLVKDLDQYPTFNSFFSRRLNATARPITSPEDPSIAVSPADCRLTVFQSVDKAKQFWIKGKEFDIPSLLTNDEKTNTDFSAFTSDTGCALAIARLAPQDYHRFHSPVEGMVLSIKDIQGALYTVNPQAINENLNVFTENKRSVMLIEANLGPGRKPVQVAFVAIGAMLVGSIGWSKKPGDKLAKGEELGWFQYGGSTCIVVFPSESGLVFDQDLVTTSEKGMETIVKVGMEIAKVHA